MLRVNYIRLIHLLTQREVASVLLHFFKVNNVASAVVVFYIYIIIIYI